MQNPIRRSASLISEYDLKLFENQSGYQLPGEYREFLLTNNGGIPRRNRFLHQNNKGSKRETWVRYFFSLGMDGLIDPNHDLAWGLENRPHGLPDGVLMVGAAHYLGNEGFVCIGCEGEHEGKVYFRPEVEEKKVTLYLVKDGWNQFLETMTYEDGKPKVWKELILDQDEAGFESWVREKRRRWLDDGSVHVDIIRAAVEENWWPGVETLLKNGAFLAWVFDETLANYRFEMTLKLLASGQVKRSMTEATLCSNNIFMFHMPLLLKSLIDQGAQVNIEDDKGNTPLHHAVMAGSDSAVQLFLEQGADPTAVNDDQKTPLDLAIIQELPGLANLLRDGEIRWKQNKPVATSKLTLFDLCGVTLESGQNASPEVITETILDEFETVSRLSLPPEYRWLLMQSNGGKPNPGRFPLPENFGEDEDDEDEEEAQDEDYGQPDVSVEFLPLRLGETWTDASHATSDSVDGARFWYHDGSEIPRGYLPIASLQNYGHEDWGYLLIGCKGKDRGKLFGFDHSKTELGMTLPELFKAFAEAGSSPPTPEELLLQAIRAKDLAAVDAALEQGAKPMKATRDGNYPAFVAAETGFTDAMVRFAKAGTKLEDLLNVAARDGGAEMTKAVLFAGKAPSKLVLEDLISSCPSLLADADCFVLFEKKGIKFNKKIHGGQSYLHFAVQAGSKPAVEKLLSLGCSLDVANETGDTLLHLAAYAPDEKAVEMTKYLLELGVKANQPNSEGQTPLHRALANSNLELCKLLMDHGEDLDATFERWVPGMNREKSAKMAQRAMKEMEKFFKELGSDLDDEDASMNNNPLAGMDPDLLTQEEKKSSELLGELGNMQNVISGQLAQAKDKLTSMAMGDWGRGLSAADLAKRHHQGLEILEELRAYAATKK
jgi:ankyrin repeat protein